MLSGCDFGISAKESFEVTENVLSAMADTENPQGVLAVVKKPEILILDDSASALDYATDLKLRQAIAGMKEKATVFIVSQRTSSIRGADQIVVLDDGQIVATGTHEELLKNCDIYREIYESQYKKEVG